MNFKYSFVSFDDVALCRAIKLGVLQLFHLLWDLKGSLCYFVVVSCLCGANIRSDAKNAGTVHCADAQCWHKDAQTCLFWEYPDRLGMVKKTYV